jgi:hypothetical protein
MGRGKIFWFQWGRCFALGWKSQSHPQPGTSAVVGNLKFQAGPGEATENHYLSRLPPAAGGTPRPPLTEMKDRRACDSDRRVTVNNIQVILVCGSLGDRGGCLGAFVTLCSW